MDTPILSPATDATIIPAGDDAFAQVRPVSKGFLALYTLAHCSLQFATTTPHVLTLALRVQEIDPVNKATYLSILLGIGAFLGIVVQPVVGLLSDHTTSRFGRRRPWMLAGTLGVTVGLLIVAFSPTFLPLLLGWCLAMVGLNMTLLGAVMPDRIPEQQRGSVSGLIGLAGPLGAIAGIMLNTATGSLFLTFVISAVVTLVVMLAFIVRLPDRRLETATRQPLDLRAFVHSFWINPRTYPDFAWVWLGRFLVVIGLAMLTNYQVFYLTDHLHIPTDQVSGLVLILSLVGLVCTVGASIAGGMLSDRLKRRKIFVLVSALIYAVGIVIISFAPSFPVFLIGSLIGSLAVGVYFAVDLALVTDVLPNAATEGAKGMGIFNIAQALPNSLAPAMAPLFLAIGGGGNYTALYLAAGVFALLGALAIQPVKGSR